MKITFNSLAEKKEIRIRKNDWTDSTHTYGVSHCLKQLETIPLFPVPTLLADVHTHLVEGSEESVLVIVSIVE